MTGTSSDQVSSKRKRARPWHKWKDQTRNASCSGETSLKNFRMHHKTDLLMVSHEFLHNKSQSRPSKRALKFICLEQTVDISKGCLFIAFLSWISSLHPTGVGCSFKKKTHSGNKSPWTSCVVFIWSRRQVGSQDRTRFAGRENPELYHSSNCAEVSQDRTSWIPDICSDWDGRCTQTSSYSFSVSSS